MSDYGVYIGLSYIFAFCLLGLQVLFSFLSWQKYLKLTQDRPSDKISL